MTAALPIQAVIVHHRSRETLTGTVSSLVEAGVRPDRVIVVDNSPPSDPDVELTLFGVRVVRTSNDGYAAAANLGLRSLVAAGSLAPYTLVCSHEATVTRKDLTVLVEALDIDEAIAAAGPTLFVAGTDIVWSTGGRITPWLHRASHERSLEDAGNTVVDRAWLDGALVLYRTDPLVRLGFDESYFLYFEETDLHLRMRGEGLRVVWVPAAAATQTSSGIPPFLLGRNTLLFQKRHFSLSSGRLAVIYELFRRTGRKLFTGRGAWSDLSEIIRGWRAAERIVAEEKQAA